jgi:hypothetical protein
MGGLLGRHGDPGARVRRPVVAGQLSRSERAVRTLPAGLALRRDGVDRPRRVVAARRPAAPQNLVQTRKNRPGRVVGVTACRGRSLRPRPAWVYRSAILPRRSNSSGSSLPPLAVSSAVAGALSARTCSYASSFKSLSIANAGLASTAETSSSGSSSAASTGTGDAISSSFGLKPCCAGTARAGACSGAGGRVIRSGGRGSADDVSTTSRAIPEPASTKQGRRPGSAKSPRSKRASRILPASGGRPSSFSARTIPRAPPPLNETQTGAGSPVAAKARPRRLYAIAERLWHQPPLVPHQGYVRRFDRHVGPGHPAMPTLPWARA